jgi:hypothetical protein
MTVSAKSNRPTMVKPRSTWVITLKTSPMNPNEPLDQVYTHPWSTLGQRHGQTPLKHWRRQMSSGTFAAFSKFYLNTSKSTFMGVVHFVEGHNFHVVGISNFEWKLVKNLVDWRYLLFPETWRHSKFGSNLCKIRGEKHYTTFVKVVEGIETYNFPIHHLEHFYTFFGVWRVQSRVMRHSRRLADAAPPRASATTLGVRAARAPP